MNLYLISQNKNLDYDTYDSAVVAAESEEQARHTHPSEFYEYHDGGWSFLYSDVRLDKPEAYTGDWTCVDYVKVKLLGQAGGGTEAGVICASFNAG